MPRRLSTTGRHQLSQKLRIGFNHIENESEPVRSATEQKTTNTTIMKGTAATTGG